MSAPSPLVFQDVRWDADAGRDDVRDLAVEHLDADEVMLVVNETGDVNKVTTAVGTQRHWATRMITRTLDAGTPARWVACRRTHPAT
jgi:SRSO17 transposase